MINSNYKQTHQGILARIVPFIWLGIFVVLAVAGLIFLSYILVIGAIVGLALYAIAYVKMRFFSPPRSNNHPQKSGTIYNHDDLV